MKDGCRFLFDELRVKLNEENEELQSSEEVI